MLPSYRNVCTLKAAPKGEDVASHTGVAMEKGNVRARSPRGLGSAGKLRMEEGSFLEFGNFELGQLNISRGSATNSSISRGQCFPFGPQFPHLQNRQISD